MVLYAHAQALTCVCVWFCYRESNTHTHTRTRTCWYIIRVSCIALAVPGFCMQICNDDSDSDAALATDTVHCHTTVPPRRRATTRALRAITRIMCVVCMCEQANGRSDMASSHFRCFIVICAIMHECVRAMLCAHLLLGHIRCVSISPALHASVCVCVTPSRTGKLNRHTHARTRETATSY